MKESVDMRNMRRYLEPQNVKKCKREKCVEIFGTPKYRKMHTRHNQVTAACRIYKFTELVEEGHLSHLFSV